ncbi:UDP-xylose and UDP-N-acetylglucosamine transporter-like [Branchiostoma floridae]|uniref:Solute carrier family 35 member B4 n=1 Tax=Branchiostoma floridae TaxID=7739 RepID=A0A9J7L593_BRAFL|nr:UDP-xylose and UDP-N-acetylglucosamine transporter-like [Branchiostoma floridae]
MHPAAAIGLVFAGCCSNVFFLELLVTEHPGAGNIVTFAQFLVIAVDGFFFTTNFCRKKPVIPISKYAMMVTMFFTVSVVNNYALNFHIPMPLHMIFRAGSLIANMMLGIILLKKSYKPTKYVAVLMITAGIFTCTYMSAQSMGAEKEDVDTEDGGIVQFLWWLLGIAMLTFALFMSARMGIYQEVLYSQYGKHPKEALFYNHALPLPAFLPLAGDIYRHAVLFSQSEPIMIPLLEVGVPKMWFFLLMNCITQYVCIRGVFILTTECASLTVTLIITLRKFVSLILSIFYFQNPFTVYHWFGTSLVFGGTLLFVDIYNMIKQNLTKKKD